MTTANIQHTATNEFLDEAPSPAGKVVMDVGCGDGFACNQFQARGAEKVYANDYQEYGDTAYDAESPFLLNSEFVSMGERKMYSGSIDIIWCHHVLEHQESPITFLKELWDLLENDGQLWLTVPNMAKNLNWSQDHTMAYNSVLLIEHLRRAWFAIGDIRVWRQRGHLRVRVPKKGNQDYPDPMKEEFDKTGRATALPMEQWNWTE